MDDDVSKNPPEKNVPTELEIKVENHIKQECEPETESMQPKELEVKVENDIKQECEPESESESMKPKDTSTNSFEVSDDHSESKSPKNVHFLGISSTVLPQGLKSTYFWNFFDISWAQIKKIQKC